MSSKFMFWTLLLLSFLKVIQAYSMMWIGLGSWNLNRTVGWGWGISIFTWYDVFSFFGSTFVFLLGYGYSYFQKKTHPFWLSILHIILLVFSFLLGMVHYRFDVFFFLAFHLLMWVVFVLNIRKSWFTIE